MNKNNKRTSIIIALVAVLSMVGINITIGHQQQQSVSAYNTISWEGRLYNHGYQDGVQRCYDDYQTAVAFQSTPMFLSHSFPYQHGYSDGINTCVKAYNNDGVPGGIEEQQQHYSAAVAGGFHSASYYEQKDDDPCNSSISKCGYGPHGDSVPIDEAIDYQNHSPTVNSNNHSPTVNTDTTATETNQKTQVTQNAVNTPTIICKGICNIPNIQKVTSDVNNLNGDNPPNPDDGN